MANASYVPPNVNKLRSAEFTAIMACRGGPSNGLTPIRTSFDISALATVLAEPRQSVINTFDSVTSTEELARKSQTHPTKAAPRIATTRMPKGTVHDEVAMWLSTTRRSAICAPTMRILRARSRSIPRTLDTLGRKLATTEPRSRIDLSLILINPREPATHQPSPSGRCATQHHPEQRSLRRPT
jgi:hypothetical protein